MFEISIQAGIPTCLLGPNGIGKTSRLITLAQVLNKKLVKVPLLGAEPSDFVGYPTVRDDVLDFVPPRFIKQLKEDSNHILLFDEINRVPPDKIQALVCQIVDRKRGLFDIPDEVLICATGNEDDLGVFRPSKMLRSRFAWFSMTSDIRSYLHYLKTGEFQNNFQILPPDWENNILWGRNLMHIFLAARPSVLLVKDDESKNFEYPVPTQRGCDNLIRLWAALRSVGKRSLEYLTEAARAVCGTVFAMELQEYFSRMNMPNVETFLDYVLNVQEYEFSSNVGPSLYLCFSEVLAYLDDIGNKEPLRAKEIWKKSVEYLERFYISKEKEIEYCVSIIHVFMKSKYRGQLSTNVMRMFKPLVS